MLNSQLLDSGTPQVHLQDKEKKMDALQKDQILNDLSKFVLAELTHGLLKTLNSFDSNHALGQLVSQDNFQVTEDFLSTQGIVLKNSEQELNFVQNLSGNQLNQANQVFENSMDLNNSQEELILELAHGITLHKKTQDTGASPVWIQIDSRTTLALVQKIVDNWRENNKLKESIDNLQIIKQISRHRESVFSNGVYLVEKDGLQYIYKPSAEQASLRAASGPEIEIAGETIPERETCAYVVSEIGGFNLVPETQLLESGSLQEFITDPREATDTDLENVDHSVIIEIATFIHLIGSRDTHKKNIIFDQKNAIHLIDNALSFTDKTDKFYNNAEITKIVAGEVISENTIAKLEKIKENTEEVTKKLKLYISNQEISAFFIRLDQLLATKTIPNPFKNN